MTPLLELRGVASGYGQSRVIWDVELDVEAGEVLALIGRNGVGKTTLLRTIVGVRPLLGGSIRFGGTELDAMAPHKRARAGIGYVPQGRHIFPRLTVEENLRVGLAAGTGSAIPDMVWSLFPKLADLKTRRGGFLSGGEQQQLAIGRALAGKPRLLLLDEPSEGVQPNVVALIGQALRTARTELGLSVLVVEQSLDFAWALADGYAVMDRGRIVRTGSTSDETAADVAHLVHI